ncbi:MAG: hypothetical protein H2060_05995 [Azoarcus sp.]|nr:hypothetical protein [Azoarcus sp.]
MTERQQPDSETTDSSRPTGRRRVLQALALGGVSAAVLPEKWVKPIIDTVIVPAHAQASIVTINGIYANQINVTSAPGGYLERFAGFFISSAHAQTNPPFNSNVECIAFDCGNNPNVAVYFSGGSPYEFLQTRFTQIFPNNVIQDLTIGPYTLTNLSASAGALTGEAASVASLGNAIPFELLPVAFNPCNASLPPG